MPSVRCWPEIDETHWLDPVGADPVCVHNLLGLFHDVPFQLSYLLGPMFSVEVVLFAFAFSIEVEFELPSLLLGLRDPFSLSMKKAP